MSSGALLLVAVVPGHYYLPFDLRRFLRCLGFSAPFAVGVVGSATEVAMVAAAFPRAHVFPFCPPEGAALVRAIGWPVLVV